MSENAIDSETTSKPAPTKTIGGAGQDCSCGYGAPS
jgi:hypothetical protein